MASALFVVVEYGLGGSPGGVGGTLDSHVDPMLVQWTGVGLRRGCWMLEATFVVTGPNAGAGDPFYMTVSPGVQLRRYLPVAKWPVRGGDAYLDPYVRAGLGWTFLDADYEAFHAPATIDGASGVGGSLGVGLELRVTDRDRHFVTAFLDVGREQLLLGGPHGSELDGAITTIVLGMGMGF